MFCALVLGERSISCASVLWAEMSYGHFRDTIENDGYFRFVYNDACSTFVFLPLLTRVYILPTPYIMSTKTITIRPLCLEFQKYFSIA